MVDNNDLNGGGEENPNNNEEEVEEDEGQKKQKFYETLEKSLLDMGVNLITNDEIEKIKPAIGKGAFGKVYKGKYKNEIMVAIKKIMFKADTFDSKDAIDDILKEIGAVTYVQMEGIPKFYGLYKDKAKGCFCLLFEFIPGHNLSNVYKNFNSKQKLEILYQFTIILEQIHKKHLIHRDIKPSNIMISENLKVTLIDFGVSKISTRTITHTGSQSGTVRYSPPELYDIDVTTTSDKPIKLSTKIDIWSTGCMISELFSGLLPWIKVVKNEMILRKKLMDKIAFPIPDEIKKLEEKENFVVCDLINKCCDVNPDNRPSATELKEMIKEKLEKYFK
jgi:serine/threonine protein kinase